MVKIETGVDRLVQLINKEKKITKILDRVEKLVTSGLTHEGTMKHETVILLKILDKLPTEKLDQQLSKTIQILNKRFSRST